MVTRRGMRNMDISPFITLRKITLDRKAGLMPDMKKAYRVSSVLGDKPQTVREEYHYGDVLSLTLRPKEILLLDFAI